PLEVASSGGGSVALSPSSGGYSFGQTAQLTATHAPGWQFLQWLGDANGTNASFPMVMNGARHVQAMFGTALVVSNTGSGSVIAEPAAAVYPFGSMVRLTAVPGDGSYFSGWNPGVLENPLVVVITNANPSVSCAFLPLPQGQFALTCV